MDSEKKSGPPNDNGFRVMDPRVINYDDPAERAYWLKAFGVSDDELRGAIHDVGISAQKVRDYLAAARDTRPPDDTPHDPPG